jgi:FAD/FMN-containing dehydrogenase
VQPGARWRHVLAAGEPHGLAGLVGSFTGVGVVGFTLGGGLSPVLGRRYGFAADHVRSVELVTADGQVRRVDADSEPDLFWAVRGGKGNFGVATALEFDLVPARRFYGGGLFLPWSAAPEVLHAFATWSLDLPEEAGSSVALMRFPPDPELPEPLRGQSVVHVRFSHLGDADEAERLFAPMRAIATPVLDNVGEMPFSAVDAVHMDPTDPLPYWYGSSVLRELPEAGVDALLDAAWATDCPLILVELRRLGGALARQPDVPNAVAGRDGQFFMFPVGLVLPELADVVPKVAEAVVRAVDPWATGGTLLNFSGCRRTAEQVRGVFPAESRDRLLAVKRAVDPDDMFRYGDAIGIG